MSILRILVARIKFDSGLIGCPFYERALVLKNSGFGELCKYLSSALGLMIFVK